MTIIHNRFTARRYAIAVLAVVVRPSVCTSVRPSHAGIVSKRLNAGSRTTQYTNRQTETNITDNLVVDGYVEVCVTWASRATCVEWTDCTVCAGSVLNAMTSTCVTAATCPTSTTSRTPSSDSTLLSLSGEHSSNSNLHSFHLLHNFVFCSQQIEPMKFEPGATQLWKRNTRASLVGWQGQGMDFIVGVMESGRGA